MLVLYGQANVIEIFLQGRQQSDMHTEANILDQNPTGNTLIEDRKIQMKSMRIIQGLQNREMNKETGGLVVRLTGTKPKNKNTIIIYSKDKINWLFKGVDFFLCIYNSAEYEFLEKEFFLNIINYS